MHRRAYTLALAAILLSGGILSCARDYVTGKRTFSLMSESQEIALGREADPEIVAEYGLYEDPKLADFVSQLGQEIARVSHRPGLQYTFRVVDSPIVNAFALPGGWVYFTRGILVHFNSEAEMAGVMGHELGHIAARHGAEQYSKGALAQIGLEVGSIVSADFSRFSGIAELGIGLLFLKFSRGQETESDRLGVEYATRLGYDGHEMASFFRTIARLSGEEGKGLPTFLSTHPDPGDREVRVHQLATEWQQKISYQPRHVDRKNYLQLIDGIVYGEDPRQGFVEEQVFYHPGLRFQFPVPAQWKVVNSPRSVDMSSPKGDAGIQFTLSAASEPQQAASDFIGKMKATVLRRESTRVHGMPAFLLETKVETDRALLQVLSCFIEKQQKVYVLHGFTTPAMFSTFTQTFTAVMTDFDELRNPAALNKKPQRVHIVVAPHSGDLSSVLRAFNMKEEALKELAVLNGRQLEDQVAKGDYLKVVKP